MEAPKKIYLTKNLLGELRDSWDVLPSENFTSIEYTNTNAFVEKACEWIKYNTKNGGCLFDGWEEDFKKCMED